MKLHGEWLSTSKIATRRYICGHCSGDITSQTAYICRQSNVDLATAYICHNCNKPTMFIDGVQTPGVQLGASIEHLPSDIEKLYNEVRTATSAGVYTSAVMTARKLLMHVAVAQGDKPGKKFEQYVDYLVDNHFAPPNSKPWVDKIRKLGNEANHEIVFSSEEDAADIIKFLEMLLKFSYEFPASVSTAPSPTEP